MCKTQSPNFAYIAPYRAQAKSVAWAYLKRFSEPVSKSINESELIVELINGATIRLFGADNSDALRGLGFDGVFLDEYADFRPSVYGSVVRPALADRGGWCVFAGTPKGKNQLWEIYDRAKENPEDWFHLTLKASESGILPPEELQALRNQTTEDQYLQEMECSFDAAIVGAFYGVEMRELEDAGRITTVDYDPSLQMYTAWDLGYKDDTAVWFYQTIRNEIHVVDFYCVSGAGIEDIAKVIAAKPYHYAKHFLPHDARAKTLAAAGKSIVEQLGSFLGMENLAIVPDLSVQDGIQAVRMVLPRCYFDAKRCKEGIEALKQYEREYDEDKKAFRAAPKHNFASHPADGFRMLALAWRDEPQIRLVHTDRPLIVGPGNTATLEDMYASQRTPRRKRI